MKWLHRLETTLRGIPLDTFLLRKAIKHWEKNCDRLHLALPMRTSPDHCVLCMHYLRSYIPCMECPLRQYTEKQRMTYGSWCEGTPYKGNSTNPEKMVTFLKEVLKDEK